MHKNFFGLIYNDDIAVFSELDEPLLVLPLDHTDVVGEPYGQPPLEPGLQINPVNLHQPVVAEQVALWLDGVPLEDEEVVLVVEHPQPVDGEGDPHLDGRVQATWLPVVEVTGYARSQHAANRLTTTFMLIVWKNINNLSLGRRKKVH